MGWIIALVVLAIVFGVLGIAIEAMQWLLAIAVVLVVVAVIRGFLASRA